MKGNRGFKEKGEKIEMENVKKKEEERRLRAWLGHWRDKKIWYVHFNEMDINQMRIHAEAQHHRIASKEARKHCNGKPNQRVKVDLMDLI